jgi:hypothetical protein
MSLLAEIKLKLKGWRTVAWNAIVAGSAVMLYVVDELRTVDFSGLFTPKTVAAIMCGLAVAGILLRVVTTTRIGAK